MNWEGDTGRPITDAMIPILLMRILRSAVYNIASKW